MGPATPSSFGQDELLSLSRQLAEQQQKCEAQPGEVQHLRDQFYTLVQTSNVFTDMVLRRGPVHASLARQVLEALLVRTAHHRARIFILGIAYVPVLDVLPRRPRAYRDVGPPGEKGWGAL